MVLAFDLGGTKLESALVSADGRLISRSRTPTGRSLRRDQLESAIRQCVIRLVAYAADHEVDIVGVGIGSAGPIDIHTGTVSPGNLPRVGTSFPFLAVVRDTLPATPVVLRHDGACIAMAEAWLGAARHARTSVGVVISTGVGAGIVDRGRPFGGSTGNAGHLGQLRMDAKGTWLEAVASGPASVAWAVSRGWKGSTGLQLSEAAASGNPVARAAIHRSATAVGRALASFGAIVDFEIATIGGGFAESATDYVDIVRRSFAIAAPLDHVAQATVVRCALGGEAPLVGSAALIWRGGE
jgi:glucokinase